MHNSISLDQVVARSVGDKTRIPYLLLNNVWSQSLSWNEKGVPIPHEGDLMTVFRRMFIEGTPEEVRREMKRLQLGRSILDDLRGQLKMLVQGLGNADRERIDVLTHSIREAEAQLKQEEFWSLKPKPKISVTLQEMQKPAENWVSQQNKWLAMMHLAVQTDSTRVIVLGLNEHGVTNVPGLEIGHHDASHHGKDPAKIEQLSRYEDKEFETFGLFLDKLTDSKENEPPRCSITPRFSSPATWVMHRPTVPPTFPCSLPAAVTSTRGTSPLIPRITSRCVTSMSACSSRWD